MVSNKPRLLIYGECYSKIFFYSSFKAQLAHIFELIDISYGGGKIENLFDILNLYSFKDDDIFMIGGGAQESPVPAENFKLKIEKLQKIIFTKYKNSKIVFWNMCVKPEHPTYNSILELNKVKNDFCNNQNIFSYNFSIKHEHFRDNVHLSNIGKSIFIKQIVGFLLNNYEMLKKNKFYTLPVLSEMCFEKNDSVTFILSYIDKKPCEIHVEYHDQKKSVFKHHYGTNVTPDRMNILKLKNVKKISFGNNIVPVKCQVQAY